MRFDHTGFRRRMRVFLNVRRPTLSTHTIKSRQLKAMCAEELGVDLEKTKAKSDVQIYELLKQFTGHPKTETRGDPIKARRDFYDTDEWRRLRYQVLLANNGCCQCCGVSAANGAQLHVDHVKPRSKYPELELEFSNLQVLCRDCNLGKGAWDQTDWRRAAE